MTETSSLAKMVKSRVSLNDGLNGFPTIETDAVRLREVRPHEDAVHWHSLLASADAGPHQGKTVQDIEEMLEGVRGRFYNHQYVIYWAIALKSDDRMIGNVRFWEWAGHPERPLQFGTIQYGLVGPDASTAAAAAALRAVGEFGLLRLGLARVQCTICPGDSVKAEALAAAGFEQEGTLRSWWFDAASQQWQDEAMFSFVAADMSR